MSPYGHIRSPAGDLIQSLVPRTYALPGGSALTVVPMDGHADVPEGCIRFLAGVYDEEVRAGRTYPAETPGGVRGCRDYFFSHACFIGIIEEEFDGRAGTVEPTASSTTAVTAEPQPPVPLGKGHTAPVKREDVGVSRERGVTLEVLRRGRPWEACVAGMFYVKPNYPGRSSHICNAGFLIDPGKRGLRLGSTLGQSYLFFAPRLGYRGSVFNLVYANNTASLRIWDRLGFVRCGLVPKAGRLRTADAEGEEWVDAVQYFISFTGD